MTTFTRSFSSAQAEADLTGIPRRQFPPHMMRAIFQGLLPGWDSPEYAETDHLPTRTALELTRYQLWPQVHWTPSLG